MIPLRWAGRAEKRGKIVRAQAVRVTVDEGTRRRLERIAGSVKTEVRAVVRAKIVLAAAAGASNETIARTVGVSVNTVRKWRGRFAAQGLKGLKDAQRSGRPCLHGAGVRLAVVATATSAPPFPESTWSHRAIAAHLAPTGISASQVGRILADCDLKPHRVRGWLTRRQTPDFWERATDICHLYRTPPEGAVVLSIDEKTAIAARSPTTQSSRKCTHEFPPVDQRSPGTSRGFDCVNPQVMALFRCIPKA
jgi:transposase